jgi:hypothetical protein
VPNTGKYGNRVHFISSNNELAGGPKFTEGGDVNISPGTTIVAEDEAKDHDGHFRSPFAQNKDVVVSVEVEGIKPSEEEDRTESVTIPVLVNGNKDCRSCEFIGPLKRGIG